MLTASQEPIPYRLIIDQNKRDESDTRPVYPIFYPLAVILIGDIVSVSSAMGHSDAQINDQTRTAT